MPITTSAKKALRQSITRRKRNLIAGKKYKEALKNYRKAAEKKTGTDAAKLLSALQKTLDKAAKAGVIKKNKASRLKQRAAHLMAKSTSASS